MTQRKRWRSPEAEIPRASVTREIEPSPTGYRNPDGTLNPERIRADDLHTVEECAFLMAELDKMRTELTQQIRTAHAQRWKTGDYAPRGWYIRTNRLLNAVNVARNEVQDRRGVLRREKNNTKRDAADVRSERRFIEAAKSLLSEEQHLAIWEAAKP
jgi:hypothetical protein